MPDHLHLLASLGRQISVSEALRDIKSNSSRWIRENGSNRSHFGWQTGYAAFSVSFSQIQQVRHYIENQKPHHEKRTFKEELVMLLKMHRVDFDESFPGAHAPGYFIAPLRGSGGGQELSQILISHLQALINCGSSFRKWRFCRSRLSDPLGLLFPFLPFSLFLINFF